MKRTLPWLALLFIALIVCGCKKEAADIDAPRLNIIPKPAKISAKAGTFQLANGFLAAPKELQNEANAFSAMIHSQTGITLVQKYQEEASVHLTLDPDISNAEGYQIKITPELLSITGKTPAAVYYAIQTFRQILPAESPSEGAPLNLPCLTIDDAPRFAYRGMHLDVSRHFFDVAVVKRYIDMLARYKFNTFHWHLTDDQGWRVQIDAYPRLNEISSWRNETLIGHHHDKPWKFDGKRYGGFYTKDEIREVIQYAADRHITIIPEIEMPGHAQAILAAYPEFGCTGNAVEVRKVWGISDDVLCPKEETFAFLEAVLTEVIDLFPGKYIHIGGDECPKGQWEQSAYCQELMQREGLADAHALQSWFVQRIEKFINSKGRVMIGWDEILEGGLAPNAVVMSWRGNAGGIEAAKQGHDVIMSPTTHVYLDYYQSTHPEEPFAIGGYLPLSTVYGFEPVPAELSAEQHKHILGAQANVWTEYINTPLKLDYMAWPRGIALAEVVWTAADQKEFTDFAERLAVHLDVLRGDGIYAANHLYDLDYTTRSEDGKMFIEFQKMLPSIVVNYSTDGQQTWNPIAGPLAVDASMTVSAFSEGTHGAKGRPLELRIQKHLATGQNISVADEPAEQYNDGGIDNLINGINGSNVRYGDHEWRGFSGTDFDATIDLGNRQQVSYVETRCFLAPGSGIHLPDYINVLFSTDGTVYSKPFPMERFSGSGKVFGYRLAVPVTDAQFVKVVAKNMGTIPDGMEHAGTSAWLFVDEIVVK